MATLKIFGWWFMIGALMALAVVMIQGGIRDIVQAGESIWDIKLIEFITLILGGGLLGGSIALILDRIRQPEKKT